MEKTMFLAILALVFCAVNVQSRAEAKKNVCKLFKSTKSFCHTSKGVKHLDGGEASLIHVSVVFGLPHLFFIYRYFIF